MCVRVCMCVRACVESGGGGGGGGRVGFPAECILLSFLGPLVLICTVASPAAQQLLTRRREAPPLEGSAESMLNRGSVEPKHL